MGVSASLYFIGCGRSSSHVPQTMPKHGRDRSVVFTQHWRARGMGRGTGDCWGRFQRCRGWLLATTTLVGLGGRCGGLGCGLVARATL